MKVPKVHRAFSSHFDSERNALNMADFYQLVGIFAIVLSVFYVIAKVIKGLWTTWLGSALGFGYNFKHSDDAFAIVTGKRITLLDRLAIRWS